MTRTTRIRRKPFWALAAVLVLGLAALGFKHNSQPTLNEGIGKVERGDITQRVTIAGTIIPARKTIVLAPYAGYVKKLYVRVGDQIAKGDPIVSVAQSLQASEEVYPLRAPFAGTVVQTEKAEGEFVKDGDVKSFIVRIDDLSRLFVQASTAELDRTKVKIGQEAIVKASAILSRSYHGVVRELSLAAKDKDEYGRGQVEYPLRIEIMDADAQLKPGMSTLIDIVAQKREGVVKLRHEYLHRDGDANYVLRGDGTKQIVKVGLQDDEASEILEGLKPGDQVQQLDFAGMTPAGGA